MNENLRAAILMARSAALNAEVAGMIAANTERERQGYALAYNEESFFDAVTRNGLGENNVTAIAAARAEGGE